VTADFYRAFEDRHRGSREEIKSRLGAYLPFIEPLKALYPGASAVDLGCGRGEWLELLKEAGIAAHGVDLDESMLAAARESGLSVSREEAIEHLRGLPDASRAVVSAFHVVEHMPLEGFVALVREALRVLQPAGLLVVETPNPENLVVGTSDFHLDPTHQRPIPPGLLAFIPEHEGFARTKLLRLQEPAWLAGAEPALIHVLRDVSPDAGVVAQKRGPAEALAAFDTAFAREHGVTLDSAAARYDRYVEARFSAAHQRIEAVEGRMQPLEARVAAAETSAKTAQTAAEEARRQMEQMLASKSWRLTAPLRAMTDTISRILRRRP
jgi:O-antigen chain-terminating methyltransferase